MFSNTKQHFLMDTFVKKFAYTWEYILLSCVKDLKLIKKAVI